MVDQAIDSKLDDKATTYEHRERSGRQGSVTQMAFNRRASAQLEPRSRRESIRKSFDSSNLAMTFPDKTNLQMGDSDDANHDNSIDDAGAGWFVWMVALCASVAGSLFGYDTGIISAVLVYLNNDLDGRPTSSGEKELITSLCSGGAFIGSIIAGLTADQVSFTPTNSDDLD